eukprot:14602509-Alexandrium_andersonii.AAC.1
MPIGSLADVEAWVPPFMGTGSLQDYEAAYRTWIVDPISMGRPALMAYRCRDSSEAGSFES